VGILDVVMPLHPGLFEVHVSLFHAYLTLAVALTIPLCVNAIINYFAFTRPRALIIGDSLAPKISVLVPARNEEAVIERCVRSLLRQNYPQFEVVVLDDNSSDATYDILCHLRDQDPKLRVLAGAALPDGWCGKPFACWQLAQAAQGDYLLLSDADCEFAPDALLLAVGALAEHRADVISLSPDYVAKTFWERVIIPLLVFIPVVIMPLPLIRGSRSPHFAGANGAFIFLPRDTYLEIDGHRAVRDQLLEDVAFAKHVKRSGKTLWYGSGDRAYRVRMYEDLPQIWHGFTRNLFPAFSSNIVFLTVTLCCCAIVFIFPPLIALLGFLIGAPWTSLALLPYLMIVAVRLGIILALQRDTVDSALLNPLGWMVVVAIAIGSVARHRTLGARWKDRVYVQGRARP
jgi:chlorobactene glucosyltransferase